ncbi:MAG TPA: hypothetical protein VFS00_24385, partial [Polyangiaceae bacterium]|nr:hypothetical protein [Polyangiaceae bacterium]
MRIAKGKKFDGRPGARLSRAMAGGAALAALGAVLGAPGVARADEQVLILLDRTGSMRAPSTTTPGVTRMDVAKARISNFMNTVPPGGVPRVWSFWTFDTDPTTGAPLVENLVDFDDGKTPADIEAVLSTITPRGNTPLAMASCAALTELITFRPDDPDDTKQLFLVTDMGENFTPPIDECFGPFSTAPLPTPPDPAVWSNGSWQWKVINKAVTGFPNVDYDANDDGVLDVVAPGTEIVVNAVQLFDAPVSLAPRAASFEALAIGALASVEQDVEFLRSLTALTGGRYEGITQLSSFAEFAAPAGDANRSGCVDLGDLLFV